VNGLFCYISKLFWLLSLGNAFKIWSQTIETSRKGVILFGKPDIIVLSIEINSYKLKKIHPCTMYF